MVAVIDSGITKKHPQTAPIKTVGSRNVMGAPYATDRLFDCEDYGHGTRVAAIIASPAQEGVAFRGLAPAATIMPIKYFDKDTQDIGNDSAAIARGINAAVKAGVDVINLSLVTPDTPALRAAVQAAGRADIVVVSASGNRQGDGEPPRYPAAYAAEEGFEHVLVVGATDSADMVPDTSVQGDYLGVVAPGVDILAPTQIEGYAALDGTSFATPYVAATVALVQQTHPQLTAPEVVNRLKATADRPGKQVPDAAYGWGIINPYRAITAERDDTGVAGTADELSPVAAPDLPPPPDHTLRNLGYAVGSGLLGLALIVAIGTVAWRHTRERER
ncbi:S8 family serine peptidase [Nocardioides sp. AE5]|uniref:S8 family serine peptidase n=1 Tax=Nocardioides sp. AE5 TaxID=2962573 RepID=UPI002880C4CA|nr:S8 family serine peptidase [Nocardioides sp. AE5]MDT0202152.1 S8 family serine peptidase [Nocardioides sp. AE5]